MKTCFYNIPKKLETYLTSKVVLTIIDFFGMCLIFWFQHQKLAQFFEQFQMKVPNLYNIQP
jgi:hypothetical protein